MAVQKQIRFLYQAKNNTTGLADVKAQVYVNGVAKAVGASALTGVEVDSTNSPGIYEITLSAANLTTWGVVAGTYSALEVVVDSATKPAKAIFRTEATVANTDDIDSRLGAPAGASVSADIASVKSDTAAIKVDLESGASSLATILSAVNAIANGAGFAMPVPATLIKPSSGSNSYRLPLTIYNSKNVLIDPDTNAITVTLVNQSGADRSSYLTGVSGTSAPAVRDSLGQYHIDVAIPSTASQEELIFGFAYAVGGAATARKAVSEIVTDVNADGFALQSTLLSTQTTVNSINTLATDATNGFAAIKTQTVSNQTAITALQTDITNNVEGTGFSASTDSLHQLSLAIANVGVGGRAV